MAAEISVAKRERDFYLSRVDKAKAGDAMRQRKQLKADKVCQGMGLGTGQHNAAVHSQSQSANHRFRRIVLFGDVRPCFVSSDKLDPDKTRSGVFKRDRTRMHFSVLRTAGRIKHSASGPQHVWLIKE